MAFLEGDLVLDAGRKNFEDAVCICVGDSYAWNKGHTKVDLYALFSPDGNVLSSGIVQRRRTRSSSTLKPFSMDSLKSKSVPSPLPPSAFHSPAQIKRSFFRENPELVLSYVEMVGVVVIVDDNGQTRMTLSFPTAD